MENSLKRNRRRKVVKGNCPCHFGTNKLDSDDETSGTGSAPSKEQLLYNVTDRPPFYLTIVFAFQQALSSLPTALSVSLFVAEAACASDIPDIRTYLLSATLFMSGLTTLLMVTVGVRLPLYQGPVGSYVIPMLALKMIDKDVCLAKEGVSPHNITAELANVTKAAQRELSEFKLREFQGSLIVAGVIHCLVGVTGVVGLLLRFIGPVTLVPTILLGCIYIGMAAAKFAGSHWGVSMFTAAVSVILSLYLGHKNLPIPFLSREKGLHIVWMPLHQMCSILLGMLAGWGLSAVLTYAGMLTDDKDHYEYQARTDAQPNKLRDANWFSFPYPNKFGTPLFNTGVFVAFMIPTLISILDSVGDYYACARVCNLHPPPRHAINRGIAIEGLCSAISGSVGCGHATTTFGENIGIIGLTKVASRDLFVGLAFAYMIFGVVSKVSAVFLSIPYPVLGGSIIVLYGMFNGIILSNLQYISLSSTRNISIVGISLILGLMVPKWIEDEPVGISTGDSYYDNIIKTLLVNPSLCGGLMACFLDNTVPGTRHERGIDIWATEETGDVSERELAIYNPWFLKKLSTKRICRFLPFCPNYQHTVESGVEFS